MQDGKFCKVCFGFVKNDKYGRHYQQCTAFKTTPMIKLPYDGKTFKFTALDAMEMIPFVAYIDTESILIPNSDVKNGINKHEIISYKYAIVGKNCEVKARKLETGGEYLGKRLIENLFEDSKKLRAELEDGWVSKPHLTKVDEIIYENTKK